MGKSKLGLVLGLLAGTAVGVLFAPRKGKELRQKIRNEIKEGGFGQKTLSHDIKVMGEDIAGTAKEVYESEKVKEGIKSGVEIAKKKSNSVKKRISQGLNDNKSLSKVVNKVKALKKNIEIRRNAKAHKNEASDAAQSSSDNTSDKE